MKSSTRASLLAGAAVAAVLAISSPAFAVAVVGTGEGNFSNLGSCDNSGNSQDCRIVNTANGTNTQVQWGSTSSRTNFVNPSTLTAVDVAINANTNTNDTVIARLDWYNSSTDGDQTPDDLEVRWNLTITFTQPSNSSDSESFDLEIKNTNNPAGDIISGATLNDLSNLSFALTGVTVSDIKYVLSGAGAFSCDGYGKCKWTNPEESNSTLYITADFTAVQRVPEPASLALLGAGLAGLGFARRRKAA